MGCMSAQFCRSCADVVGDHDVVGAELPFVRRHEEAVVILSNVLDGGVVEDRCGERCGVPGEEVCDLGRSHAAVRVAARVGVAGESGHPVRRQEVH
jgi:hypothetical protein